MMFDLLSFVRVLSYALVMFLSGMAIVTGDNHKVEFKQYRGLLLCNLIMAFILILMSLVALHPLNGWLLRIRSWVLTPATVFWALSTLWINFKNDKEH